jgi:hypothetical protein
VRLDIIRAMLARPRHLAVPVLPDRWGRPILLGLSGAGVLLLAYMFVTVPGPGYDAWAYWGFDLNNLYPVFEGMGAHKYPPPFFQVMAPFSALPWPVFLAGWTLLGFAALVGVAGRFALACLVLPPVSAELFIGNVQLLMALSIVAGFRRPWTWAFILLTKPTCGIGLLWFAVRREWRSLFIALGATAAIAAVSFVVAPDLWRQWWESMVSGLSMGSPGIAGPFLPRVVLAAIIVTWGALTDRRWTVPVAVTLSLPFVWIHGLAVLVAVIPLLGHPRSDPAGPASPRWAPAWTWAGRSGGGWRPGRRAASTSAASRS